MPTFCRHNHLIQNCTICSREQAIEARPIVSSSAPRSTLPRPSAPRSGARRSTAARGSGGSGGLRVRQLERGADDGYSSPLVPGLRSSVDAARLADELAFAAARLQILETRPPGAYAEIAADDGDIEERTWLAFLVAYLSPLDAEDPFAAIEAVRTPWSGPDPEIAEDVPLGPRTAHAADRGTRTIDAYRAWVARLGSQAASFTGEDIWTPERRFDRVFERLSLPGMHRAARFDLLTTLGRLGVYEMRAGALRYGGENEVTVAAKRAFGIGDVMLLERRTAQLAQDAGIPLEAFDLGLFNWGRGERSGLGVPPDELEDETILERTRAALHL